ncbi:MAG: hypothetical protein MOGMAGMI_00222 [Candidatus Omnitrophica bacterium]|nr:hypothetical protein [Candidatus Omnitrophota bacterium]
MNAPAVKWALITGASGGIGLELAEKFAAAGNGLVLVARRADKLEADAARLRQGHGVPVRVLSADLSADSAAPRLYEAVRAQGIEIEYLVNNAGVGNYGRFGESDLNKDLALLRLNIESLTALTKLFLKDMIVRKSGRVMNVASTAAYMPGPYMATYYASKAYVLSFSEAIAEELSGSGVTVTVVCPGPTMTGFHAAANMGGSRLFSGPFIMTAADVARIAYDGLMSGRRVVITGWTNRLMVLSSRLAPRRWATRAVRYLQEKIKKPA